LILKGVFLTITDHNLSTSDFYLRWTQTSFSQIVHSALPSLTLQGDIHNNFPLLTGGTTKRFYFRWLNNLKFSEIF